jgi:hypothetical protein
MPRRAAKTDRNQRTIVDALRRAGATVTPLHTVGQGVPDLLVGYRKVNYLLEVKDGTQPPSRRKLTPDEAEWHGKWRGSVHIVNSADEALAVLGVGFRHKYRAGVQEKAPPAKFDEFKLKTNDH